MAIATKKIATGLLATTNVSGVGFNVVSGASDWFESHASSPAPRDARQFTVSLVINTPITNNPFPTGTETMAVNLFESDDLAKWDFVAGLSLSPGVTPLVPGLYEAVHTYTGSPKKYFRLQFAMDDPVFSVSPPQQLPFPTSAGYFLECQGACWVTVSR